METVNFGMSNQEELQSQANDLPTSGEGTNEAIENIPAESANQQEQRKHRHHSDHSVSRKYKMFSNHSSANNLPHTNTSF